VQEPALVVGVSSRALFDLRDEDRIFQQDGLDAYCRHQIAHEQEVLAPGTGFPLVRKLLRLNEHPGLPRRIEVVVMSRNNADTSLRIFHSIRQHGLDITRAALSSGAPLHPYLEAFHVDLFLSAHESDVRAAVFESGIAAALIYPSAANASESEELRIAFDGDAVLFSEEAEHVFQQAGLAGFEQHEVEHARRPLPDGPFAKLFRELARMQSRLGRELIRTALVTARGFPTHERVVRTLRAWNVHVDEAFFLSGGPKHEVLAAFQPHLFFDDHPGYCASAAEVVPTARVPGRVRGRSSG
jgi:5'-nucleotidase